MYIYIYIYINAIIQKRNTNIDQYLNISFPYYTEMNLGMILIHLIEKLNIYLCYLRI